MRETLDLQKVAVRVSVGDQSPRYLVLERWLMEQAFAHIASKVTPRRALFSDITEPLLAVLGGEGYSTVAQPTEPMCTLDPVVTAVYFQDALIIRYCSREQEGTWLHIFCFGFPDPQPVVIPRHLTVDGRGNICDTWRRLYYPTLEAPWPWPVLQPNRHWAIGRLAWIVELTEPGNLLRALMMSGVSYGEIAKSLHKRVSDCLRRARVARTLMEVKAVADDLEHLASEYDRGNPLARLITGNSLVTIVGRQIQDDLKTIARFICADYRGEAKPVLATATR